jgi:hypothetical protein
MDSAARDGARGKAATGGCGAASRGIAFAGSPLANALTAEAMPRAPNRMKHPRMTVIARRAGMRPVMN